MGPNNRILIYLLRRDLRLSDNPIFHEACKLLSSSTITHLLPVYVFSAAQIETSGFRNVANEEPWPFPEARSRVGAFWRCGPHRAKFVAETVWDLKTTLEANGSGLSMRAGVQSHVVKDILEYYQEGKERGEVVGVWMTGEKASEETDEEDQIQKVVEKFEKEFRVFKDEKYFVDE